MRNHHDSAERGGGMLESRDCGVCRNPVRSAGENREQCRSTTEKLPIRLSGNEVFPGRHPFRDDFDNLSLRTESLRLRSVVFCREGPRVSVCRTFSIMSMFRMHPILVYDIIRTDLVEQNRSVEQSQRGGRRSVRADRTLSNLRLLFASSREVGRKGIDVPALESKMRHQKRSQEEQEEDAEQTFRCGSN